VIFLNKNIYLSSIWKKRAVRLLVFPATVVFIYGLLFIIMPDKATMAIRSSGRVLLNITIPLGLVFILMLALNFLLKPAHITKFLGREAGIKGILLSVTAGIISAGPIYAWYPMLKAFREKGADSSFIAIFLGNRAVKPFLLPIMILYFGWIYALILTVFTIFGSLVTGYCMTFLVKENRT
jgi:uncharacterized membrane protein YraQ (UPF0718 family)